MRCTWAWDSEEPILHLLLESYHIVEWPGLKRTTMIMEFQPFCYVQGHQPLVQAAQSHIQPGLECLQGWGIRNLLGQPIPVHHHPLCEKIPPNIQPKPPLSQFKTIPPCPVTIHPCKQLLLFLFICSLKYWKPTVRSPQTLLFSKLNNPSSLTFLHRRSAPAL